MILLASVLLAFMPPETNITMVRVFSWTHSGRSEQERFEAQRIIYDSAQTPDLSCQPPSPATGFWGGEDVVDDVAGEFG